MKPHHLVAAPVLTLALVTGCRAEPQPPTRTAAQPAVAQPAKPAQLLPLSIKTKKGVRRFRVEVARTREEQGRGLMFRTALPADGGMIFPFDPPRPASFWMKNTIISLDMIFIRADGTIAKIAAKTTPYLLDPVVCVEPVAAVLEVGGGTSAKLGIREGDVVTWNK